MYQQINRAALKADARAAMRESRANPYVTALVLVAVSYLLNYLSMRVTGLYELMPQIYAYLAGAHFTEEELLQLYYRLNGPRLGGQLIDLLISAVQLMLNTGFMLFCLLAVRRAANALGNLLDSFGMFFRILGLSIVTGVFTFLWSLLLFVPGIIAAYSYRQAYYLLLEHPEMGIMECIRESKALMYGHKAELFVLDLSFLGWMLLTAIPFVSVYVLPYTETTYAAYYVAISTRHGAGQRQM